MEMFILNQLDDIKNVPSILGIYSDRSVALAEYKKACESHKTLELSQYAACNGKFEFVKYLKTKGCNF